MYKIPESIKTFFKHNMEHKKILCFLLGMLSVRALPPFYELPWLFLTLSSFLLILNSAQNQRQSFAFGYWFGFGFFACNLSWIGNALLIDVERFGGLYPLVLLASGAFFGLFIAFPAWLSFHAKNIYARWLCFSAFWVIFEWIRSFILTGFPWNLIGSSLAFSNELIQFASVGGTYGLSLLLLLACSAPFLWIKNKDRNSARTSVGSIVLIFAFLYVFGLIRLHTADTQDSDIKIRIVQPAIPQEMKWNRQKLEENFAEHIKLSQSPGLEDIDFVIWGETATPFALDFEPQYMEKITAAIPNNGYLITGLVRYVLAEDGLRPANSMYIINKQGKIVGYYDKSHLVPFGEYIPLKAYLPQWVRPITNTVADFAAGNGPQTIKIGHYPSMSTLICYEIIFPHQILPQTNQPKWIVNLTNDGWYGNSQGPYQHLVSTSLRAVEEGKTIVRVANTGISALISPYGEVINKIDLNQKGYLDVRLPQTPSISTIYNQCGNFVPLILCLINILISFFYLGKKS